MVIEIRFQLNSSKKTLIYKGFDIDFHYQEG